VTESLTLIICVVQY